MVTPLLVRTSLRYLTRHPWQSWLTILGITLGVAIVIAVDLANHSSKRSFDLSLNMVTGQATHQIIGGPTGIPENFYADLRTQHGLTHIAPVVSGHVFIKDRTYTLLGIDPFAEYHFRAPAINLSENSGRRLFLEPNRIAISTATALRHEINHDDWVELVHQGKSQRVQMIHLTPTNQLFDAQGLLLADIATAQELLNRVGTLDRIDLILKNQQAVATVTALLPPSLTLQTTQKRNQALTQMTRAFHINLSAMGLLALLVGGFLIYNTMTFMVLQRRTQLGTLRILGTTPKQIFLLTLSEALILGLIGSICGLAAGLLLGQGLVQLVTRTINDLYYVLEVTRFEISPLLLLKGLTLGMTTSLIAALLPALEASRSQPVNVQQPSSLQQRLLGKLPLLTLSGLGLLLAGLALIYWPSQHIQVGFVALACIILGFSLMIPLAVRAISLLCSQLFTQQQFPLARLAVRNIAASISRTGLAVAALTIAVATTIGVGVMTGSFRHTVEDWLIQSLNSDVYISLPGRMSIRGDSGLPAELVSELEQHPAVASVWRNRTLKVETEWGPVRLMAIAYDPQNNRGFNLKEGELNQARESFLKGEGILLSEPLSYHTQRHVGDSVTMHSPQGPVSLTVLGVFYDYTSSHGLIIMPHDLYTRLWHDHRLSAMGLYRKPDIAAEDFLGQLQALASHYSDSIRVRSNEQIRANSLAIFDRTFTITHVLRLLALIVAFIGILSTLMALQLERLREFAILRASGATIADISRMILLQTAMLGLFSGLLAIPLGLVISRVLVDVINLRSFGWSMQYLVTPSILLEALLLALIAALLAGIYPALHTRRLPIAQALREE